MMYACYVLTVYMHSSIHTYTQVHAHINHIDTLTVFTVSAYTFIQLALMFIYTFIQLALMFIYTYSYMLVPVHRVCMYDHLPSCILDIYIHTHINGVHL